LDIDDVGLVLVCLGKYELRFGASTKTSEGPSRSRTSVLASPRSLQWSRIDDQLVRVVTELAEKV